MHVKQCVRCNLVKPHSDFHKAYTSRSKDNLAGWCKKCTHVYNMAKLKTYKGRLQKMLSNMKKRAKERGYECNISFQDFNKWSLDNGYEDLYKAWKESNYSQNLVPTVDRLNALGKYEFSNMQLLSYEDNISKSRKEHKTSWKPISQIDPNTGMVIASFNSIAEATKHTHITGSNISRVLNGIRKSAGGFLWK